MITAVMKNNCGIANKKTWPLVVRKPIYSNKTLST